MLLALLNRILKSIALVPSIMACSFLLLAILLSTFEYDYSQNGFFEKLIISEKEDVQTIFAFTIGGIFTLTVFSYTMVMNVLNRNINNYSPRLIPILLSERHHQIILGFTSGTIVYCLAMSIPLNNTPKTYFPEIAGTLAIVFAITCTFLFIYFLHSVSQSIHINQILYTVFERAKPNLDTAKFQFRGYNRLKKGPELDFELSLRKIGHLKKFDLDTLEELTRADNRKLAILCAPGTFLNTMDMLVTSDKPFDTSLEKKLTRALAVDMEVPMDVPETSFKHLVEVAVKACSPAINDPGTALTCIDYLTELFIIKAKSATDAKWIGNEQDSLLLKNISFTELLYHCYLEMHTYMKDDHVLPKALSRSLFKIREECEIVIPEALKKLL